MRKVLGMLVISGMLAIASVLLIGFNAWTTAAVNAPHLTVTASRVPALVARAYLPALTVPELPVTNTVTGTVVINGGGCCAGGMVGETVTLNVQFAATSAAGPVTRMRVGPLSQLSQTPWEDLVPVRNYTTSIYIANWIGWGICAQFRDSQNNVSPTVCDDIALEGMPDWSIMTTMPYETPTPTPTATSVFTQTQTATPTITPSPTFVLDGT